MNLYHCMIELKSDAKALAFAAACTAWMEYLQSNGLIAGWRLMRRKFGLSSGAHTDFLLEVEVTGMAMLDDTFRALGRVTDEPALRRYEQMHAMIDSVQIGLYRPYPDPEQRERIALI